MAVSTFKSQKALLKIYILITGLWKCNYAPLSLHSVSIWKVLSSVCCSSLGITSLLTGNVSRLFQYSSATGLCYYLHRPRSILSSKENRNFSLA